jgi:hypothetical protein
MKAFFLANIQWLLVFAVIFVIFEKQWWSGYFVELELTTILFTLFLPIIAIVYQKIVYKKSNK